MGATYTVDKNGEKRYSVYTKDEYFEVKAGEVVKQEAHSLGMIPIIEYPANKPALFSPRAV